MNEKTKLLDLFSKVKWATLEVKKDNQQIQTSERLSKQGKAEDQAENRLMYKEAIDGYREQMLAIVDARENDYIAWYKKTTMDHMKSFDYQSALMINLETLRKGYMGKVEILALLELYDANDVAINIICDILKEIKSPYLNLTDGRITINKQLNAFESIRNVIKSTVNMVLYDRPGLSLGSITDESRVFFGSGYYAIKEELNEDLTLKSADASLALQANEDKKHQVHYGENSGDIVSDTRKRTQPHRTVQVKDPQPPKFHPGTLPVKA